VNGLLSPNLKVLNEKRRVVRGRRRHEFTARLDNFENLESLDYGLLKDVHQLVAG
jgi:hypothetical protein